MILVFRSMKAKFLPELKENLLQPLPQRIFLLQEEREKEALEHFKHVIKICPNSGHIFIFFRINYGYKFGHLVCRA